MPLFHDLFGVAGAAGTDVALGLPNGCKTAVVAIGPRGWLITGELDAAVACCTGLALLGVVVDCRRVASRSESEGTGMSSPSLVRDLSLPLDLALRLTGDAARCNWLRLSSKASSNTCVAMSVSSRVGSWLHGGVAWKDTLDADLLADCSLRADRGVVS